MAVKTINGINGTYYGWHTDPNISYGQGLHSFLLFVAVILILFYLLPFSIALLLPPLILRTRSLAFSLKPLLDAFWNPFKANFRFWLGFRAILRLVMALSFADPNFLPFPTNCFLLIIVLVVLLLFQLCFRPFEGKLQNILDECFLLKLLLLAAGAVFFGLTTPNSTAHIAFVSILLALTYLVFLFDFALHINIRFPVIRKTAIKHYYWLKQRLNKKQKCDNKENDHNDPVVHKGAREPQVPNITYSELREPFLDYGEGDFL